MSEVGINIRAHDRASRVFDHVGRKMGAFGKQGIGMGIAFAGVTMAIQAAMGAIQGIGNLISESFEKAREFEKGIAEVSTMLDEASTKYLPEYRRGIEELSIAMGKSAPDLIKGLYQTLSASVDAGMAMDFLGKATKAAVAGVTSVETAVDVLTTVMNAYGYTVYETTYISDILFKAVQRGKQTFEDIAGAIGYVIPLAAQSNVALEQIAASMATLTRQGINATKAATGLRALISQLISPSEEAKNKALEYGIVLNDLSLEVLQLSGMIEKMNDATGGSTTKATELIPNIRALTAYLGLAGDEATGFSFDLGKMNEAMGATELAALKMQQSVDFTFSQIEQRIEALKRELGGLPAVAAGKEKWAEMEAEAIGTLGRMGQPQLWIGGLAKALTGMIPFVGDMMGDAMSEGFDRVLMGEEAFKGIDLSALEGVVTETLDSMFQGIQATGGGVDEFTAKLYELHEAGELPADEFISYMNRWGSEIERTTALIERLEGEIARLGQEIADIDLEIANYQDIKDYEEALHYIPLALEESTYASGIFETATKNLVNSIQRQRQAIQDLEDKQREYAAITRTNQIEILELQLKAMNRRGRMTRAERNRIEELNKINLEQRINQLKTQDEIENIKDSGLTADEQRLEKIKRRYANEVKIIRDSMDTTLRDMIQNRDQKMMILDTYENEYLPTVRAQALQNLDKYNAGLNLIENKWSAENIKIWEDMADDIETQRDRIMRAKAQIHGTTYTAPSKTKIPAGGAPDYETGRIPEGGRSIVPVLPKLPPALEPIFRNWPNRQIGGLINAPRGQPVPIIGHGQEYITPADKAGARVIKVEIGSVPLYITVSKEADFKKTGEDVGKLLASGIISGVESEIEVG